MTLVAKPLCVCIQQHGIPIDSVTFAAFVQFEWNLKSEISNLK